jgi:hypothetical protein
MGILTLEYYNLIASLTIKKKYEILSFASKWMELENIILSEISWAQKSKSHTFFIILGI